VRRRTLGAILGAAVWPLVARAQQSAPPVVGFLRNSTADGSADVVAALRQGLNEAGYVEGRNVAIEFRWSDNRVDRLPELAADLVRRQCALIVGSGVAAAHAVKAATATIPVVFLIGEDPVRLGLVASLNRPGGNVTGISLTSRLAAKQLELLREMAPTAASVGIIASRSTTGIEFLSEEAQAAAIALGQRLVIVAAGSEGEIDMAFATLAEARVDAFLIAGDALFVGLRDRLVALPARQGLPAIYEQREFVAAGGLMSYGTSFTDAYRQVGLYAARILKGDRPADLPVMLPTKFELVINLRTARALGFTVPQQLLIRADEVIE
jgi:putative ABC transport system substrate-binding protein